MKATYKYKVYRLNDNKQRKSERLLGLACWCYNHCIALHKRYYRLYGKHLNANTLKVHLTKLKRQSNIYQTSMNEEEIIISISDACRHEDRKLKEGTTKEKARDILLQLWEDDYLDLTYTLWINGEIDTEYNLK